MAMEYKVTCPCGCLVRVYVENGVVKHEVTPSKKKQKKEDLVGLMGGEEVEEEAGEK